MRTLWSILSLIAAVGVFPATAMAEETIYHHNVLLINSYHQNLPWTADLTRGVEEVFANATKQKRC